MTVKNELSQIDRPEFLDIQLKTTDDSMNVAIEADDVTDASIHYFLGDDEKVVRSIEYGSLHTLRCIISAAM